MKIRQGSDAILVGVNTVLADDPQLTCRSPKTGLTNPDISRLRRIVLDSRARIPLTARVVRDEFAGLTTVVVTEHAPAKRVRALANKVNVWISPAIHQRIDLNWLLGQLGQEQVTSLLVEGGAEINAAFLMGGFAHRVAFFYAPKIIGGRRALGAVGGLGAGSLEETLNLSDLAWKKLGADLFLTAKVQPRSSV
jgi:diaminohydroxyphosphoribosylaminopyrimidine deaminase/5-amino-6-(5-phosphoribosylamino)uracil reductase